MTDNEIIQEATEAVEKGLPCAFLVPHLLDVVKEQKSEIAKKDTEIDILIRKKEALRDEIAEQQAEIERLQKILVGFMDEVGTWSNKYDVDISNIYKLPLLAKEDFNIKNTIKSEAYREFADKLHDNFISKVQKHYCRLNTDKYTEGYTVDDVLSSIVNTLKELTRNLHATHTKLARKNNDLEV